MSQFISTEVVTTEHLHRLEQLHRGLRPRRHGDSPEAVRPRRSTRRPLFRPLRGRLA